MGRLDPACARVWNTLTARPDLWCGGANAVGRCKTVSGREEEGGVNKVGAGRRRREDRNKCSSAQLASKEEEEELWHAPR